MTKKKPPAVDTECVDEDAMHRAPYVHRRAGTGNYLFALPAPPDLAHHFNSQWAERKSLRTPVLVDANKKARLWAAEWTLKFEQLRRADNPEQHGSPAAFIASLPIQPLSPALIAEVAAFHTSRALEGDDAARMVGISGQEFDNQSLALQIEAGHLRQAYARGEGAPVEHLLPNWLAAMGFQVAEDDPLRPALIRKMVEARLRVIQARIGRQGGELIDTPSEPAAPALRALHDTARAAVEASLPPGVRRAATRTLHDVVPIWKGKRNAKPNAIQRMSKALELWDDAVGTVPLDQITRERGGEFVLYLLDEEREFGRKTAANHASNINALMNVAVGQGLVPTNPLDLQFVIDDSAEREPWTPEQLLKLHGQPPQGAQPLEVDPADADVLINMLLWSGARIGEIAGLRVQDVQERDGILAAYIRRETTKEDASVRWLPIASAIREAVSAHAKQRQEEGKEPLFPSFHRRTGTGAGDMAGRWFRLYREHLGLPSGHLHGSHKWRHTVRTKLAGLGIGEALLDAVTGHQATGGSSGRRKYTHIHKVPLTHVLEAVERLAWPWPSPAKPDPT